MTRPPGWARCLDNVADVLRRGAWYPILEETPDGLVVVECWHKPVRMRRRDVQVRTTYAVCPHCHGRQDFNGRPPQLTCVRCARETPIDWSETC